MVGDNGWIVDRPIDYNPVSGASDRGCEGSGCRQRCEHVGVRLGGYLLQRRYGKDEREVRER